MLDYGGIRVWTNHERHHTYGINFGLLGGLELHLTSGLEISQNVPHMERQMESLSDTTRYDTFSKCC